MLLSRHSVGTYLEMSSPHLSGNIWPQSSQLAEPLWTDLSLKSGISVRKLIPPKQNKTKQTKNTQAGNELSNILPKSSHAREKQKTNKQQAGTTEQTAAEGADRL